MSDREDRYSFEEGYSRGTRPTQGRRDIEAGEMRTQPVRRRSNPSISEGQSAGQSSVGRDGQPVRRRIVSGADGQQVRRSSTAGADSQQVRRSSTAAAGGQSVRRSSAAAAGGQPVRRSRAAGGDDQQVRRSRAASGETKSYADSRSAYVQNHQAKQAAKKKRKRKLVTLIAVEVLVLVLLAGVGFAYFYVQNLWDSMETVSFNKEEIQTNEDLHHSVVEKSKGYTTIMLYGVDARDMKDLVKDANADTSIICCINNDTKEIKLVSVLRDTLVETTENKHTKLNVVYAGYGVQEAIQTVNKNFDLNITQYVTVNWKAVAQAVDILGGLDIELRPGEAGAINDYIDEVMDKTDIESEHLEEGEGMYHLDGVQVTTYARVRSVGTHDIRRAERQRTVITKMLEAAKSADLSTLNKLVTEVFPGISTNFTMTEVLDLAMDVTSYTMGEQALFPFKHENETQSKNYYVYANTLTSNVTELHKFLYDNDDYEPSPTVQSISDYILDYWDEHP